MSKSDEEYRVLKAARLMAGQAREQLALRQRYAPDFVAAVNDSMQLNLSLSDFITSYDCQQVVWPKDIRSAPGLVSAYIDRKAAEKIVACIDSIVGRVDGFIHLDGKHYLGGAKVHDVKVSGLLGLAAKTEGSPVFSVNDPAGLVMVDCYLMGSVPQFTVLVQGAVLVDQLGDCFG